MMGNDLSPTDWGWHIEGNVLVPTMSDKPIAPEKVTGWYHVGSKKNVVEDALVLGLD